MIHDTVGALTDGAHNGGGLNGQDAYTGRILPVAHSIRADGFDASEDGTGRWTPIVPVAFESRFVRNGRGAPSEVVPPLKAQSGESGKGDAAPLVAFNWQNGGGYGEANDGLGISIDHAPPSSTSQVAAVATAMQVRRLTPTECERLQGFPDGWTAIPHRGKPAADGPRYRALGNSMAVPVIRWIGRQIERAVA